ncbi:MAG: GNAT family N-acetyltransferase [Treponema sp.]
MTLVPLAAMNADALNAVFRFTERHERLCVKLPETLLRSVKNAYAVVLEKSASGSEAGGSCGLKTEVIRIDGKSGFIYGVLNIRSTLLHCLPFAPKTSETQLSIPERNTAHDESEVCADYTGRGAFETLAKDFICAFADFFAAHKTELRVSCVNGTEDGSKLLLAALKDTRINLTPAQVNEYGLFRLTAAEFLRLKEPELPNGERISRCGNDTDAALFDKLFDLQKRYEIEEVLPECDVFSEDICRLHLKAVLRTQYVAAVALADGTLAAKAGTNALGFQTAQLGGVYVKPEFRRRGYAFCAVYRVLKNVFTIKNAAVLFVKKTNTPAIALYKSLGFKKVNRYIIAYFR